MISPMLLISVLVSCEEKKEDEVTVEAYVPPQELELPSLDGIDVNTAFTEAITLVGKVQLNPAWKGNREALSYKRPSCPDIYVGMTDDIEIPTNGVIWNDFCNTGTGLEFSGYTAWVGTLEQSGDIESPEGNIINGTRQMSGQALVRVSGENIYEFKGTGQDALYRVQAPNYDRWTYSATINGTIQGSQANGEDAGFRSDMYIYATGGDANTLEARGNVFWKQHRIQNRFDSAAMDILLVDPASAGPDDCALEPKGWIGIRDENSFWYDLVFMPMDAEDDAGYEDEDRSQCDGCGTLYLRGNETQAYGEICPDFSSIWTETLIDLPQAEDFVFTFQQAQNPEQ
ncbi:MAG: hypothetical protein CL916_14955 [Deltaproteobacteria bacterium]|nr:hypothetical protein [Deltaproteobacteria bacterium]